MNRIDKSVAIVVVAILGCMLAKAVLEAAAMLIVPVLASAGAYAVFRGWQKGLFAKLLLPKEVKKEG